MQNSPPLLRLRAASDSHKTYGGACAGVSTTIMLEAANLRAVSILGVQGDFTPTMENHLEKIMEDETELG